MNLGSYTLANNIQGAVNKVESYEFTRTSKSNIASGSDGYYTLTIPITAKAMRVYAIGGGGGGGSGRRGSAGTARWGGGGGASGGVVDVTYTSMDSIAGKIATIIVGAGGPGGASTTTDDTNGVNGATGGASTFTINNQRILASPGLNGSGGTSTSGNGGSAVASMFQGNVGGNSSVTGNSSLTSHTNTVNPASGSGGGGISTSNVSYNGGQVRGDSVYNGQNPAYTSSGASSNGASLSFGTSLPGGGGGGGNAGTSTTVGSSGGNGGNYGGGGGGGGASFNGYNSGAGGNGGNGYVRITIWF